MGTPEYSSGKNNFDRTRGDGACHRLRHQEVFLAARRVGLVTSHRGPKCRLPTTCFHHIFASFCLDFEAYTVVASTLLACFFEQNFPDAQAAEPSPSTDVTFVCSECCVALLCLDAQLYCLAHRLWPSKHGQLPIIDLCHEWIDTGR